MAFALTETIGLRRCLSDGMALTLRHRSADARGRSRLPADGGAVLRNVRPRLVTLLRRRAQAGCCGRSSAPWRALRSRRSAAGSRCAGPVSSRTSSLRKASGLCLRPHQFGRRRGRRLVRFVDVAVVHGSRAAKEIVNMSGKYLAVSLIGLLPFVLAACNDAASSSADPRMQPPLVRIETVEISVQSERSFTGIVAARVQSDLGFRVPGKVLEPC